MKKLFLVTILFVALISSCVPKSKMKRMEAQLDSLSLVSTEYEESISKMTQFIDALAISIDSIAMSENILLISGDGYGRKGNKYRMMENIAEFEALLSRQKERIYQLDSMLQAQEDSTSTMRLLLTHYKSQLEEKENYIVVLKKELNIKDKRINTLENKVNEMSGEIDKLNEETGVLETILKTQSDYINKGYFWIASKSELKKHGILKGASKVNLSNLPLDKFVEIDIRDFTEIKINTQPIKILSSAPMGSYKIENHKDGSCSLRILNPTEFWSITSYLVIQTK